MAGMLRLTHLLTTVIKLLGACMGLIKIILFSMTIFLRVSKVLLKGEIIICGDLNLIIDNQTDKNEGLPNAMLDVEKL